MSKTKSAEKNINKLKRALISSNFNLIQCRTRHMLQFLKRRKSKKKNVFVTNFHKAFKSLYNPDKFLEASGFGCNFRDLQQSA